MKSTCKGCKQLVEKKRMGQWNAKTPKFVDEEGRPWNGRLCYRCNNLRLRLHMRLKRSGSEDAS